MDRIVIHTKQPDLLRELWAALSDDAYLIAECIARPALAERLTSDHYLRETNAAKTEHDSMGIELEGNIYESLSDLTGPALAGFDHLPFEYKLSASPSLACATDNWASISTLNSPTPRNSHTAVWTGVEMIIYGGGSNTGGRYIPATDTWASMAAGPLTKAGAKAIWTGSEMIVWGGFPIQSNSGLRYSPATNMWTLTSTINAPSGRISHTVVWTGSEMIVWGGNSGSGGRNDGARYHPETDSWAITNIQGAPIARDFHTAVWTGEEMIIWGGQFPSNNINGHGYDPLTNAWRVLSTINEPEARTGNTTIWTGSEMIVWGGQSHIGGSILNDGARYDPMSDVWSPISSVNAPSNGPINFATSVWTGEEMIVWTGNRTGGRYHLSSDIWTGISPVNAPTAIVQFTSVWTGSQMIIWGGEPLNIDSGRTYCAGTPPTCNYSIFPTIQSFTPGGGGGSVSVMATSGCVWSAVSNISWVSITSGDNGVGDGTVNYFVDFNPDTTPRTGTLTIAGITFTINQAGISCTYSIIPIGRSHSSSTGTDIISVNTTSVCPWAAVSIASWLMITAGANGTGKGIVSYSFEANAGPARMGTLIVAGQTFTVTQGSGCSYSLDRTHQSYSASAGAGTINVTAPAGCDWDVTNNNPSFITVTSGNSGNGNGSVTYSVTANPSNSPRSGTMTIAGQVFTVYQGISFLDVPTEHPFYTEIGKLSARGVTLGCNATNYCPDDVVTRQQMAAFIIRALGDFNPLPPAQQRFLDVPPSNPFYAFIEQMAIRQITLGCGGGNYCPADPVLRDQIAAFIIRALHQPGYIPPQPAQQRFLDVLPTNPFYAHIEEMAVRQITLGCGGGNYCPSLAVTRGQMAAFLVRAFNL